MVVHCYHNVAGVLLNHAQQIKGEDVIRYAQGLQRESSLLKRRAEGVFEAWMSDVVESRSVNLSMWKLHDSYVKFSHS